MAPRLSLYVALGNRRHLGSQMRPVGESSPGLRSFRLYPGWLAHDADRQFWVESSVTPEDNCDVEEDKGQVSVGVEIVLQMSHNALTKEEEYVQ